MDKKVILDIASTLHAVFCPLKHEDDVLAIVNEKTGLCNWYIESQCEGVWDRDDHRLWYIRAAIFVRTLEDAGKKDAEILDFLNEVLKVCRLTMDLRMINHDAEKQLMQMLCAYYEEKG